VPQVGGSGREPIEDHKANSDKDLYQCGASQWVRRAGCVGLPILRFGEPVLTEWHAHRAAMTVSASTGRVNGDGGDGDHRSDRAQYEDEPTNARRAFEWRPAWIWARSATRRGMAFADRRAARVGARGAASFFQ